MNMVLKAGPLDEKAKIIKQRGCQLESHRHQPPRRKAQKRNKSGAEETRTKKLVPQMQESAGTKNGYLYKHIDKETCIARRVRRVGLSSGFMHVQVSWSSLNSFSPMLPRLNNTTIFHHLFSPFVIRHQYLKKKKKLHCLKIVSEKKGICYESIKITFWVIFILAKSVCYTFLKINTLPI